MLVLDRGYPAYWLFALLQAKQRHFCIRLKLDFSAQVRAFVASGAASAVIDITPSSAHRPGFAAHGLPLQPLRLRLVRVPLSSGQVEVLATSCDGTLATTAQFTSVRVVCNNTLQLAVGNNSGAVKVPHSTVFDPKAVKEALGIGLSSWDCFIGNLKQLSRRTVSPQEAQQFFQEVMGEAVVDDDSLPISKPTQQLIALYSGAGMGSMLTGARGTAWGLLNAVTEYVDHHRRARNQDYRLDSAWFGQGAQLKQRALEQAWALVA
ncbi:DUF932 domain-containing protein [Chromobacterium paludis]|uniref:DUF932 domain-containing protein n=1 Tax=Chromobacterium paludis TaxID=2605945 RepID=A0A5C1DMS7_9NEIS|nr:DUF932 domain-containing protein [Chromobacterium paludis]